MGYAVNTGHVKNGVYAIAVPIFSHEGEPIAGMSLYITVTPNRISKKTISTINNEYLPLLTEKGRLISSELGYGGNYGEGLNEIEENPYLVRK